MVSSLSLLFSAPMTQQSCTRSPQATWSAGGRWERLFTVTKVRTINRRVPAAPPDSIPSVNYLQRSYPSEYKRNIRIEFIIISIEDTSGSSWLYLIIVLTNPSYPSTPLHFPSSFDFCLLAFYYIYLQISRHFSYAVGKYVCRSCLNRFHVVDASLNFSLL